MNMANINGIHSKQQPPPSKESQQVLVSPKKEVPKTSRLLSCSRMEVHKKEVDERKQGFRKIYGKGIVEPKRNLMAFVTKVQIRSKRPSVDNDKDACEVGKNNARTAQPPTEYESQPQQEKVLTENKEVSGKDVTRLFQRNYLKASSDESIDLLWAESDPQKEKREYLEINKLVRYLSQRQRESTTLCKIQRRPTASFSRPTKGEITLWMKSPVNKSHMGKSLTTEQHDRFLCRSRNVRERAWSLPVSHTYSPSVENIRLRQKKDIRLGRPFSVPTKQIPKDQFLHLK
jgi:hypothetical protein